MWPLIIEGIFVVAGLLLSFIRVQRFSGKVQAYRAATAQQPVAQGNNN